MFRIGNRDREGKTVKLSTLIQVLIDKLEARKEYTIEDFKKEWESIVGSLAVLSEPVRVEHNMLYIKCQNHVVANEVILSKTAIMNRFREKYGIALVDLRTIR